MRHGDFQIGSPFVCSGRMWRCTDIGTRTIVAIRLDHEDDPSWYSGPPYAVLETVFDENDQEACMSVDALVLDVGIEDDNLIVDLMDGRTISVPLARYPRLLRATLEQLANWQVAGGGYGIHWPDIDEDLSTNDLVRDALGLKTA